MASSHMLFGNLLLGLVGCLLHSLAFADPTCYYVDGTSTEGTHTPCFPDQEISPCCVISTGQDACLDTGLCMSNNGLLYQGACTDQSYMSPNCSHFCPDPSTNWAGGPHTQFWNVFMCNPNSYCCRRAGETTDCCSDVANVSSTTIGAPGMPVAQTIAATKTVFVSGTGATSSTISTTPAESTGCVVPANDTQSSNSCGSKDCSSKAVTVGAGVGVSLGTLLLLALTGLFFSTRARKRLQRELERYRRQYEDATSAGGTYGSNGRFLEMEDSALAPYPKMPAEAQSSEVVEIDGAGARTTC